MHVHPNIQPIEVLYQIFEIFHQHGTALSPTGLALERGAKDIEVKGRHPLAQGWSLVSKIISLM